MQALTLLNDEGFHEFAQGLAYRVLRDLPDATDSERLDHLFRICLTRPPRPREKARLELLLTTQRQEFQTNPAEPQEILSLDLPDRRKDQEEAAWYMAASVLLNVDEFFTRE